MTHQKNLKKLLVFSLIIIISSCGGDPFMEKKDLEGYLVSLDDHVKELGKKNISTENLIEYLNEVEKLVPLIQEGRDEMAQEADRLTKQSYELNSKRIESLKEGRLKLYEGLDEFLVCSYQLTDLIKRSVYYHDRDRLEKQIFNLQFTTTSMVQRDAPHSTAAFSYYKNLSKITSQTADEAGGWYYTIEVNIGYNFNEKNTQTLLNNSKVAMGGLIRSYFSSMTKDQVMDAEENDIKAGLVLALNEYLLQFTDFKEGKMEGVKLVTFDMIQYYEFH